MKGTKLMSQISSPAEDSLPAMPVPERQSAAARKKKGITKVAIAMVASNQRLILVGSTNSCGKAMSQAETSGMAKILTANQNRGNHKPNQICFAVNLVKTICSIEDGCRGFRL